jgi:hypothetical protein
MTDNIRVPPDSTGKRAIFSRVIDIGYSGATRPLLEGEEVVAANVIGTVAKVVASTVTAGNMHINVDGDQGDYIDTESITVNGSAIVTIAGSGTNFYVQNVVLAGGNNPFNIQSVDGRGSAYVRFEEGPQQLDAFGLTRNTTPTPLGSYTFEYDDQNEYMQFINVGAGSHVHLSNEASVALDVGTASGDVSRMASNRYHLYQPGSGQLCLMTVAVGDTGKSDCRRRWGYFSTQDGIFFELDGSTLYTVLRSSATGSIVDTRVAQASFNGDVADGTGGADNLSQFNIDVSKINIYWIDFAWLGSGRVRAGTFASDGARVTLHTFENSNTLSTPYMGTGTLPIRAEIENTALTASPSRLKMTCAAVFTEGTIPADRERRTKKYSTMRPTVVVNNTDTLITSLRSRLTVASSITNRVITIPEKMAIFITGDPVLMTIRKNSAITSANYSTVQDSAVEAMISGAYASQGAGREMISYVFSAAPHNESFPPNFSLLGENIKLDSDGTYGATYDITMKALGSAGASSTVMYAPSWIDVI